MEERFPESARDIPTFPFSAIVGQDSMKRALILNAIDPHVGGVLIAGEKGTAKSTAVRALARLLPSMEPPLDLSTTEGLDSFKSSNVRPEGEPPALRTNGVRMVELPLNATEEMVVGGLDFSASIRKGTRMFQPGILVRAHGGILYIDEVNLLADHLTDAILSVSASGMNLVQREGISFVHPARFVLVGTMNPEEGELRPQLLDRFGLAVRVQGEQDPSDRISVLQRRDEFDRDPEAFCMRFESQDTRLAQKILGARQRLPLVRLSRDLRTGIAEWCARQNVAGHRADIVMSYTARALAAFEGRDEAVWEDVHRAADLAIPHRARTLDRQGDAELGTRKAPLRRKRHSPWELMEEYPDQEPAHSPTLYAGPAEIEFEPSKKFRDRGHQPEAILDIGEIFRVKEFAHRSDTYFRNGSGRRSRTRAKGKKGRYVRSTASRSNGDIAFDATLRAAAPFQLNRTPENGLMLAIEDGDIREKIRETRTGNLLLFIVDASGSMGAKGRMVASKGAIMSLLHDAYQKRDRLAMVSFRQQKATVNLPPTSSFYRAGERLRQLPVGGKTPLAAGLRKGQGLARNVMLKDPSCRPIVIIITDGKANESVGRGDPFWEALSIGKSLAAERRIKSIVVDAEEGSGFKYRQAARLAEVLRADYFRIKDLRADLLLEIVRSGA